MNSISEPIPGCRVLLIEDDEAVAKVVRIVLAQVGFQIEVIDRGDLGLKSLEEKAPDILILDVNLPGMDGIKVCREARRRCNFCGPILFLTVRDTVDDEVAALDEGGDDYLAKPFEPAILVARVRALLRRYERDAGGDFKVDRVARAAFLGEVCLKLTPLEFELLSCFDDHFGEAVSRQCLLDKVWGEGYIGDRRVVDVHVRHLRKKMESAGDSPAIVTVRGMGYRLE